AKSIGVANGDLEQMRAQIKLNLEHEVKRRTQMLLKEQVMSVLLKVAELQTPNSLVQQDQQRLVEMARQELHRRNVSGADTVPIPAEVFKDKAERRVRLGLIVAELVKTHALQAKPEQIKAQIEELAQSYE